MKERKSGLYIKGGLMHLIVLFAGLGLAWMMGSAPAVASSQLPIADANDHRAPVHLADEDEQILEIKAGRALWYPQEELAPPVEVYAFSRGTSRRCGCGTWWSTWSRSWERRRPRALRDDLDRASDGSTGGEL